MNSMFSVAGNPGIKVVDVGVMLGVHRTTLEKNGIQLVKLDQTAKIEEYWTQYDVRSVAVRSVVGAVVVTNARIASCGPSRRSSRSAMRSRSTFARLLDSTRPPR
jgi:hypothetical protein